MTLREPLTAAAPGMSVIAIVAFAGLCIPCIAAQTGLTPRQVAGELRQINAARRQRWRPRIGPFYVYCQACEERVLVYRLSFAAVRKGA